MIDTTPLLINFQNILGELNAMTQRNVGAVEDYEASFEKMCGWAPDIFLGNHTGFFRLKDKRKRQIERDTQASVNNKEFSKYLRNSEAKFKAALAKAKAGPQ